MYIYSIDKIPPKKLRSITPKPTVKVLLQQQKSQIEDAIAKAQAAFITRYAQDNQISLGDLDEILTPIIESCTKDSISNGNYNYILIISQKAKLGYGFIGENYTIKLLDEAETSPSSINRIFINLCLHKPIQISHVFFINYNFRKNMDIATNI